MKILALNPRPKSTRRRKTKKKATKKATPRRVTIKKPAKKNPAKKGQSTMATKRKRPKKRRGPAKRGPGRSRRRAYTRNPSAAGILSGTSIPSAARSMLPMTAGALIAKVAQKRFGDKTSESGNWTWKDYVAGAIGTLAGSLAARHLLRSTAATQQKVLEGGLLILTFKLITQEIVPMSATAEEWLGNDGQTYSPGDVYQTADGASYLLGADGMWKYLPANTAAQFEQGGFVGSDVVAPGRLGAAPIVPRAPQRDMAGESVMRPSYLGEDEYEDAWGAPQGRGAL